MLSLIVQSRATCSGNGVTHSRLAFLDQLVIKIVPTHSRLAFLDQLVIKIVPKDMTPGQSDLGNPIVEIVFSDDSRLDQIDI